MALFGHPRLWSSRSPTNNRVSRTSGASSHSSTALGSRRDAVSSIQSSKAANRACYKLTQLDERPPAAAAISRPAGHSNSRRGKTRAITISCLAAPASELTDGKRAILTRALDTQATTTMRVPAHIMKWTSQNSSLVSQSVSCLGFGRSGERFGQPAGPIIRHSETLNSPSRRLELAPSKRRLASGQNHARRRRRSASIIIT